MKYLKISLIVLFLVTFSTTSSISYAHSGRTDSSGGHNCYVGACAGTYHYHNGGYQPPPVYIPRTPQAPVMNARFTYLPNDDGTFNITMDWNDVSNTGFSVALQNYQGADPGPLADTYSSEYTFTNIAPGTYYANMKVGVNGTWSNIVYWTVTVPEWYAPIPTSEPTNVSPEVTHTDDVNRGLMLLGATPFIGYGVYKLLNLSKS